ncbi:MAG: phosphate transport system permease protein PstA [Micavibrio sp.]|nr:MAG: phosphate transport system permease protein PstA [Micavibrio sp.]
MIKLFERQTRIAMSRVKKKKSPFMYKSYSKKPKHKWIKKRKAAEKRFKCAGFIAILISSLFLASLIWNIFSSGRSAFTEAQIRLPVTFESELVEQGAYRKIVQNSILKLFPYVEDRKEKRDLFGLVSRNAPHMLKEFVTQDPTLIGTRREVWIPASSTISIFYKQRLLEQSKRGGKVTASHASWVTELAKSERMRLKFNTAFFKNGDSREAEQAGVLVSTIGSFMTILICIAMAFPLGVATAIYLEEFAPKKWFTDFIEININNLAAVPSIIFGLLGLSIYLNLFGVPRSSSLVGGMVLALLILPVIVIATRNALQAVPPSIRYAAAALGATPTQVVFHHTLIYALPGIMTGVILSIARAFGETAPLLMIGMVAFVADIPKTLTDPATTLPVQVYLWASNPELGFVEKTAAAIMVLLTFMILINLLAIYIRRRFEIKW